MRSRVTVPGAEELARKPARDLRFRWVVLCALRQPIGEERFVVWFEDRQGFRSVGYYTSSHDDAQGEFRRRS